MARTCICLKFAVAGVSLPSMTRHCVYLLSIPCNGVWQIRRFILRAMSGDITSLTIYVISEALQQPAFSRQKTESLHVMEPLPLQAFHSPCRVQGYAVAVEVRDLGAGLDVIELMDNRPYVSRCRWLNLAVRADIGAGCAWKKVVHLRRVDTH